MISTNSDNRAIVTLDKIFHDEFTSSDIIPMIVVFYIMDSTGPEKRYPYP